MEKSRKPKIWRVRWIPLPKTAGITLPPFGILVERRADCPGLRAHELVHWEQYRRFGLVRFYVKILWQYLRYGHDRAPMEREAVERSGYPRGT